MSYLTREEPVIAAAVAAKTCRHCSATEREDLCPDCARCDARCGHSPTCITRKPKEAAPEAAPKATRRNARG